VTPFRGQKVRGQGQQAD